LNVSFAIFSAWKQYFFILTDVGLLYFKQAGSAKPIDFIPIIGYLVIDKGGYVKVSFSLFDFLGF